jgi:aminocarboxymuconate-semialdehyde decarboxylase
VFTPEALQNLAEQVGVGQLMIGTDHPIPWNERPVDHIEASRLSPAEKDAILGLNAARLLGIRT